MLLGKLFGRKRYRLGAVFLLVVVGVVLLYPNRVKPEAQPKVQGVLLNKADIKAVVQGTLEDAINFTGDLSPKVQTIISSEIDARVLKVFVDEGQLVKAGQVLALLDSVDLSQAVTQQQSEVIAAKAKYLLDQQKMEKQQELLKQGFISKLAYDELETNSQASYQSFKAQEALLKRSQKQLSNTKVVAPFAGVVYQRSIEQGQYAQKNTKLFALANLESMEIRAAIPSDKISRVRLGQVVNFRVETDNHYYQGKISRINQVAEAGTRSYLVYIDFNNHSASLKAGQFIKGQVVLQSLAAQNIVSCDSIRSDGQHSYVLKLAQGKVESRVVELRLGNNETNRCAISGVSVGDKVLVGNVLTVKAGDSAQVVD